MKKPVSGIITLALFLFLNLLINPASSSTFEVLDGGVVLHVGGTGAGNYTRIQDALDNASDGDTVYVHSGVYYEHNIVVDKKISLVGEDKNTTVINAVGRHQCIQIYHDGVVVKGFTVRNTSYAFDWWCNSLLEVNKSRNVVVEDNVFISDYAVPNNKDNYICGICLLGSRDCVLRNNSFYGCSLLIYYLDYSYSEKAESNVEYFIHDIDPSNKVNEKPIYYYKNQENVVVPSDAGEIVFVNTNYSKITGFKNYNTAINILFVCSNNNLVDGVKINDSLSGFWLHYSNHNVFRNITVNRTSCSLFLWHSNHNFFQNNILPSVTIEQYSDHNVFVRNLFRSSRTYDFSIQMESSDYNVFKCNNIYGLNLLKAKFLKRMGRENVSVIKIYNSHHTIWDRNYWDSWVGLKNSLLAKHVPKVIVGLYRGIYVPFPYFNFPGYVNFDWHPMDEPYSILLGDTNSS